MGLVLVFYFWIKKEFCQMIKKRDGFSLVLLFALSACSGDDVVKAVLLADDLKDDVDDLRDEEDRRTQGEPLGSEESNLGDACQPSESFYALNSPYKTGGEFKFRMPAPGDNKRRAGSISAKDDNEELTEAIDKLITYYVVSDPSTIVDGLVPPPPFTPSGSWNQWDGDQLIRAVSEDMLGGITESSVAFYSGNGDVRLVSDSDAKSYAEFYENEDGGFWVWGRTQLPVLEPFSSKVFRSVEISSDKISWWERESTFSAGDTEIINTGIGCVEVLRVTVTKIEEMKFSDDLVGLAVQLTNDDFEKLVISGNVFVHPILGEVRRQVSVDIYQKRGDFSPIGSAVVIDTLVESNLTYLLGPKVNN